MVQNIVGTMFTDSFSESSGKSLKSRMIDTTVYKLKCSKLNADFPENAGVLNVSECAIYSICLSS